MRIYVHQLRMAVDNCICDKSLVTRTGEPEDGPSELEAWNGAVVRLGQQVRVATRLHAFLYHSLLPLELRARSRVQFPA